jgi:hypothetical protein
VPVAVLPTAKLLSAFSLKPKSDRLLGGQLGWAHSAGGEKGRSMTLDTTTTFLIVFAAALALMGVVAWLRFHFENKKRS